MKKSRQLYLMLVLGASSPLDPRNPVQWFPLVRVPPGAPGSPGSPGSPGGPGAPRFSSISRKASASSTGGPSLPATSPSPGIILLKEIGLALSHQSEAQCNECKNCFANDAFFCSLPPWDLYFNPEVTPQPKSMICNILLQTNGTKAPHITKVFELQDPWRFQALTSSPLCLPYFRTSLA